MSDEQISLKAEVDRLKNELTTHFAKIKEQEVYIEKLESIKAAYDDISTRHKEASEFAQSYNSARIGQNIWHIALNVAKQSMNPKMITIEKGIIVIMRDGTIINFPDGNDEAYTAWIKTLESNNFLVMLGAREEFLEHELERAEADQIVRNIYINGGSVDDFKDLDDRIEMYSNHTDPRKYTKNMQEEMAKPQDPVKP